jgi:hypothetical protein
VTDPRASDVAQAARLLAQAADDGVVRLPVLSAAELWVLCGDHQVLADEVERIWWNKHDEAAREKLAVATADLLAHRGLLGDDPGTGVRPMVPELAMILAARQRPAVVALGICPDGGPHDAPRVFGLSEHGQPPQAAVFEVISANKSAEFGPRFGPLHHFSLVSVDRAAWTLARWSTEVSSGRRLLGSLRGEPSRVIDMYRPGGEALGPDRLIIEAGRGGRHPVSRQRPGGHPEPIGECGPDELTSRVTQMLAEATP